MMDMVVTQEPAIQYELIPQEAVMTDTIITHETIVPPETTIDSITAPQEPVTNSVEDVPLVELFSQIEKKIRHTEKSKINTLITENGSLKEELKTLKQELETTRQKNPKGINMDILALTKDVMDKNKKLMCFECGNIYFEAGYKVVKVSVVGGPTTLSIKTEHALTATHKTTQPRRSQCHKEVVGLLASFKQEPLFPSRVDSQETQIDYVLQDKETQTDC
jgi:hypothetical protein